MGGSVADDRARTAAALAAAGGADLLVVDHYGLDARWEEGLRERVGGIVAIDDLHDRPHACDLLLDHNIGHQAVQYDGLLPEAAVRAVGSRYAILAPHYAELRPAALARREGCARIERVLVSIGGIDADDVTGAALAACRRFARPLAVDVVLASSAPGLERARCAVAEAGPGVRLHVDTGEMARLAAEADVAIGAAGVTALERCALGLPTVMVVAADNQIATAERYAAAGAALPAGPARAITPEILLAALNRLDADGALYRSVSRAAAEVCDGHGLERIAEALADLGA